MSNLFQSGIGLAPFLQVQHHASTTPTSVTLTSWASTDCNVTITPVLSTSKFLILVTGVLAGWNGFATIFRNSTNLLNSNYGQAAAINDNSKWTTNNLMVLDTPATGAAITYEVRIRTSNGGNSVLWGGLSTHTMTVFELQS